MINIIKQEITIEESLRQRLEFICEFSHTTPIFINGFIHKVDKQEDEIDDLKEKNSKLQSTINFFENLFDRLVKFIK